MKYIVVQAGGKGTRMEGLTQNKPKALVPVGNLPMLFHLFKMYPEKRFIVIGDYKYDVLVRYLHEFAQVDYKTVCATGQSGTCAGLTEALSYIPEGEGFMLIWCDLVLPDDYRIPESDNNVIGISKDFPCRWKYENNLFTEEKSSEHGVAGHFIFKDKSCLRDVPKEGEFVRWLQQKGFVFEEQPLYRTHEYGLYSEWDKVPKLRCRPFNNVQIDKERVYKTPLNEQGKILAVRETAWYKKLKNSSFENIPQIYSYMPLCMERIKGKNIYEYDDIAVEQKESILRQLISCLKNIHDLERIPADTYSYRVAYLDKTYDRLKSVRNLVPFANDQEIIVNGRICKNIFYNMEQVEKIAMKYLPGEFCLIHGDCTFSNVMLRDSGQPVLIDPRGYFGTTEFFGDAAYDWAKLYYSLLSNYDQFNLKRFTLTINKDSIELKIRSNHWEDMEDKFFELLDREVTKEQMRLLLAVIWLSLTTYAWEDYDSICGAFYNGLYYLAEVLE